MKHLKKKFINHFKFNPNQMTELQKIPDAGQEFRSLPAPGREDMKGWILTEDGEIFQTFRYKVNGQTTFIPEPNPVVIYFDSARNYFKQLQGFRDKVFENSKTFEENLTTVNGDFYWYFSLASSYAIFLFTALEAFVNKSIPNGYEYRKNIQDKKTELYNNVQVQRHIEFLEKIKKVLPEATGKHFVKEHTHKYEYIKKLKEFRDEVAHTKVCNSQNGSNSFENLYALSLEFEYEKTLYYMRDFINFHEPGLIEECDCGRD